MDKPVVREQCRRYRTQLDTQEYGALSRQIAFNLASLPELESARVIHAFWPHLPEREIDIRPLLCYLRALGRTVGLPVVDYASSNGRLMHRMWISERSLVANRWGILEPKDERPLPKDEIDVVLVPALGLDRSGHRVGFGKGYYDRFLAQIDALTVCPMYAACIVERINSEPHDVSVDVTVTEHDVMRHVTYHPATDA